MLVQYRQQFSFEDFMLTGTESAAIGQPLGRPIAGIAVGRSGVCSILQLKPVPGKPTVVRGPPLRDTGILNEVPRPSTEIELNPPLPKLKRSGPRRAGRRKRKALAISDF